MQVFLVYLTLIIIWTTTPLAIQWSSVATGFEFSLFARMLIGVVLCYVLLLALKQKITWDRLAMKAYLAASIGIFGAMFMVYWGSQYIPSGLIAVIFGLTPLFTAVLEYWILGKKNLDYYKITGILLGVIGLIIIFNADLHAYQFALKGVIGIFIASLLHAASAVLTKKYQGGISSFTITTAGLLISLPFFLLVWLLFGSSVPETIPVKTGLSILYLGIIATVIGFNFYYIALQKTDPSTLALINLITPVTALILGAIVNHEIIAQSVIYGTSLILIGLFLNQQSEKLLNSSAKAQGG